MFALIRNGSSVHLVRVFGALAAVGTDVCSGLLEHSEPEQIEAGSAVHLSFDELESMDLPFHLALAPRQLEGGFDRVPISG